MKRLETATLDDYLCSFEPDGHVTDHVQREAAAYHRKPYGTVKGERNLEIGRRLWTVRQSLLLKLASSEKDDFWQQKPSSHLNCRSTSKRRR